MLASMHAMVLRNPGPDADFECTQCPLPEPGPGQVRIRVAASSVNPLDLKLASGQVALLPPGAKHPAWRCGRYRRCRGSGCADLLARR